jgi:hypothetical protein
MSAAAIDLVRNKFTREHYTSSMISVLRRAGAQTVRRGR